jgi:hypothetical protein
VSPFQSPDPLVQQLTAELPLVALDGYLANPSGSTQRLYHDASLSFWVDIPENQLVHKEPVELPGLPDASVVWVRRGATLTVGAADPDEEQLPASITPEDLLTGDPPRWADVKRVYVEREAQEE